LQYEDREELWPPMLEESMSRWCKH